MFVQGRRGAAESRVRRYGDQAEGEIERRVSRAASGMLVTTTEVYKAGEFVIGKAATQFQISRAFFRRAVEAARTLSHFFVAGVSAEAVTLPVIFMPSYRMKLFARFLSGVKTTSSGIFDSRYL